MRKTESENMEDSNATRPRSASRMALLAGVAGGLAVIGLLAAARSQNRSRRFGDRAQERRDPMHFFEAGTFPQRRRIDRSGEHPLFERRQSVYDSY